MQRLKTQHAFASLPTDSTNKLLDVFSFAFTFVHNKVQIQVVKIPSY